MPQYLVAFTYRLEVEADSVEDLRRNVQLLPPEHISMMVDRGEMKMERAVASISDGGDVHTYDPWNFILD